MRVGTRHSSVAALLALALAGCSGLSVRTANPESPFVVARSALKLQTPVDHTAQVLQGAGLRTAAPFFPRAALARYDEGTGTDALARAELAFLAGRDADVYAPREAAGYYYEAAAGASRVLGAGENPAALELYNKAVERFLRVSGGLLTVSFNDDWLAALNGRGLKLRVRRDEFVWRPERFDDFRVADDYSVYGLSHVYRLPGVGVPLLAVREGNLLQPRRSESPGKFYPSDETYPATAILRFDPSDPSPRPAALLELHDPLRFDTVQLHGREERLASDLTTPLGYHLSQRNLRRSEFRGLVNPAREAADAGLYLLHPYEPGKIPVVLVHGLFSSPRAWAEAINELRQDPEFRHKYQFLVFRYPTGVPFVLSASLLRGELAQARQTFAENAGDEATFDRMVVVGHSMGGLITKTLISDSGDELWKLVSPRPFGELQADPKIKEQLRQTFFLTPQPSVARAVFIATPHRGSWLGNALVGQVGSALIRIPHQLIRDKRDLVRANGRDFFTPQFLRGLPTSIDQLEVGNPVLDVLDAVPLAPVPKHSVIGQRKPGPVQEGSDGVVQYWSSHLEGVESELIVPYGHFSEDKPETVEELRRVLREHLRGNASGPGGASGPTPTMNPVTGAGKP